MPLSSVGLRRVRSGGSGPRQRLAPSPLELLAPSSFPSGPGHPGLHTPLPGEVPSPSGLCMRLGPPAIASPSTLPSRPPGPARSPLWDPASRRPSSWCLRREPPPRPRPASAGGAAEPLFRRGLPPGPARPVCGRLPFPWVRVCGERGCWPAGCRDPPGPAGWPWSGSRRAVGAPARAAGAGQDDGHGHRGHDQHPTAGGPPGAVPPIRILGRPWT